MTFSNIEDFKIWLEDICKNEKVEYVLTWGSKISISEDGETRVSYYNCDRSIRKCGKIMNENNRKRAIKMQSSSKLNFACTSQMKVTRIKDKFYVIYYKSHYNHDKDVEHLHILKTDTQEIANKLMSGVSCAKILDQTGDHIIENDLQRIHLLTCKDINNIKTSYGIDTLDH